MKIIITRHAKSRMVERSVKRVEVCQAIKAPDRSGCKLGRQYVMKRRKNGHLLIVYFVEEAAGIIVVTVITTSRINKYLSL